MNIMIFNMQLNGLFIYYKPPRDGVIEPSIFRCPLKNLFWSWKYQIIEHVLCIRETFNITNHRLESSTINLSIFLHSCIMKCLRIYWTLCGLMKFLIFYFEGHSNIYVCVHVRVSNSLSHRHHRHYLIIMLFAPKYLM